MDILKEKKDYFNILANNDFPYFIIPYLNTPSLKRLSDIGLFCGVDYNQIPLFEMRYFYSRLDHSIACACLTWSLTQDKEQTILALLHDLGTPVFSHSVDFMLNDFIDQESSEKSIVEVIKQDQLLLNLINKDQLTISTFSDLTKYPIIENKSPQMCVDRLESILSGGLVWLRSINLADIKIITAGLDVLINENNNMEIGFTKAVSALTFFKTNIIQAIALQTNEDKLSMSYLGDILKYMINENYLKFNDLFTLTESDIILLIKKLNDPKLLAQWYHFEHLQFVNHYEESQNYYYQVSMPVKLRYTNPLYREQRMTDIFPESQYLLNKYLNFKDSAYASVDVPISLFTKTSHK